MVKQCYELCYNISWTCKRGACSGLEILLTHLLKEDAIVKNSYNWFINYFTPAFSALMFLFYDLGKQVCIILQIYN